MCGGKVGSCAWKYIEHTPAWFTTYYINEPLIDPRGEMTSKRAQFSHIRDWAHFEDHPGSINEEWRGGRPERKMGRIGWIEDNLNVVLVTLGKLEFTNGVNTWVANRGVASYGHGHGHNCDCDCDSDSDCDCDCGPTLRLRGRNLRGDGD